MSILGNRVLRKEDVKFLTVGGTYVDDVEMPGAAWVTFVRSPLAHGRIERTDVSRAREAPGVVDVFSSADLGLPPDRLDTDEIPEAMARPLLADGVVRFVGEPVVAVVASLVGGGGRRGRAGRGGLRAAACPSSTRRRRLTMRSCFSLNTGTNVVTSIGEPGEGSLFDGCEVVVRQRIINQRVAPCPMEVRAAAAEVGPDGRLTFYASSQAPFMMREVAGQDPRCGREPDPRHLA